MNNLYADNGILVLDEWKGHSNFKLTADVEREKLFDLIKTKYNEDLMYQKNFRLYEEAIQKPS